MTGRDRVEQSPENFETSAARKSFVEATNHELRCRILAILTDRDASPVQLGRELGAHRGVTAYHCRKLEELGMAEVVWMRPVRGSTEKGYRAVQRPWFSNEEWASLDPNVKASASGWTLDRIIEAAADALNGATFDRRGDRHLSRVPMNLDDEGWVAVNAILNTALEDVLEQQARSDERMTGSDEEPIRAVVGMMSFEVPPLSSDDHS